MVVDLAPDPSRFPFVHEKILITDELVKRINAAMKATPVDAKTPPPAATKTTSP
jgi:hypothetical protein